MVKSLPPQIAALQSSIEAITVDLHNLDASLKRTDGRHDETDARVAVLEDRDGRLDDMAAHVASLKDKVDQHNTLVDAHVGSFNDVLVRLAALEGKTGQHDGRLAKHDEAISEVGFQAALANDGHVSLCKSYAEDFRRHETVDLRLKTLETSSMGEGFRKLSDRIESLERHVGHINFDELTNTISTLQQALAGFESTASALEDRVLVHVEHSDTVIERVRELESIVRVGINVDAPDAVSHDVETIGHEDDSASELDREDNNHREASGANDELLRTATSQPGLEAIESQQDSSSGVTAATVDTIPETVHVGGAVKPEPLRILDTDSINADGTAKNGEAVTVVDAVATLLCSSSNPEKHKFEDLVNLDIRVARYAATFKYSKWGVAFEDRSCRLEFDFLRDGQTIQMSYDLLPAEFWGKRNLVYQLSAAGKWEPERMERITMPEGTIYPADFDWFARRADRLCKELLMAAKFGDAHGHFQSGDYL